jgi:acyl-CoA reductase LuxC
VSAELDAARGRVMRLLDATRRAVARGPARDELVGRLEQTTGLSRASIEAALDECLELEPENGELDALLAGVPPAPRAHVILPSNVFVAAHRALALALAATPRVRVKPSRREPAFCEAVHARAPELFELATELTVAPGDHVFAYGSDLTLEGLRRSLPAGTVLHAHGSGFGVAIVELASAGADPASLDEAARAIARDTARFDQRGCLSPRFVLAVGEPSAAADFAERLAASLAALERELPLGNLDASERAEARWWLECAACLGRVWPAGSGWVAQREPSVATPPRENMAENMAPLEVPPAGRHLEIIPIAHVEHAIDAFAPWLTSVGCSSLALERRLAPVLPNVRVTSLGRMQRPAFDGPVDRRPSPAGELIAAAPSTSANDAGR